MSTGISALYLSLENTTRPHADVEVQAVRALAFRDELADACLALGSGAEGPGGFVAVVAHLRQHVEGDHSVLGAYGQLLNMREQFVFLARGSSEARPGCNSRAADRSGRAR